MDASNRRKFPITNIGSVTLMMILIVLCMVTFAALSLSTAVSDHQAAKKSATHVHDYYEASNQAEEQLASIDEVLQTAWRDAPDQASYYDIIRAHYADATGVSLSETDSGMTLSWKMISVTHRHYRSVSMCSIRLMRPEMQQTHHKIHLKFHSRCCTRSQPGRSLQPANGTAIIPLIS